MARYHRSMIYLAVVIAYSTWYPVYVKPPSTGEGVAIATAFDRLSGRSISSGARSHSSCLLPLHGVVEIVARLFLVALSISLGLIAVTCLLRLFIDWWWWWWPSLCTLACLPACLRGSGAPAARWRCTSIGHMCTPFSPLACFFVLHLLPSFFFLLTAVQNTF